MLEIKSLNFQYAWRKSEVFKDLNLTLVQGGIYGLLGLNGEGKTTLLKLITGMLLPTRGSLKVGDQCPVSRSTALFHQLYFIPDETQLPATRIKQFGERYGQFYPKFDQHAFSQYIGQFGLDIKADISSLSYGQQKKVHLSFGIAANTPILLLDEPTNGLDIPGKSVFRQLISQTANSEKICIISTHQNRDIEQVLTHILILKNGQCILQKELVELNQEYCITDSITPEDEVIFKHENMLGVKYLIKNKTHSENPLDIEFLFQAFNSICSQN